MSGQQVILYGYDMSPFTIKTKKLLLFKKIAYRQVHLGPVPPRPELLALGIPYRRVPVLAIGNDVYCDSTLITDVLERRFPPSQGYPSFYPPRIGAEGGRADTGFAKILTTYWTNKILQRTIAMCFSFEKFPAELLADRAKFFGAPLDFEALRATEGPRASALASHLSLLEEQLSDGRPFLLDTDRPGLLDIQVYQVISWVYSPGEPDDGKFPKYVREVFDPALHPKIIEWLARMKQYLQPLEAQESTLVSPISGEEASKIVLSSSHENAEDIVGFEEAEGRRLAVKVGDTVSVTPTDTGFISSVGRLVALNRQEVVLEVDASEYAGTVKLHFPRLEFAVKKV
ncbi:hypothetical protein BC629DRAFT_1735297 [Irpex lacteus]|nr:hypothetical protein BC629DRAFT_1735297 [Irpex lacteus]